MEAKRKDNRGEFPCFVHILHKNTRLCVSNPCVCLQVCVLHPGASLQKHSLLLQSNRSGLVCPCVRPDASGSGKWFKRAETGVQFSQAYRDLLHAWPTSTERSSTGICADPRYTACEVDCMCTRTEAISPRT